MALATFAINLLASATPAAAVVVTVNADRAKSPPVSPAFVGLSFETYDARKLLQDASGGPRLAFAQALRNLHALSPGPHEGAVLRIGGDSSDQTCWEGAAVPPGCDCGYNLTSQDLDAYNAFATAAADINITFALGTNLGCGSPALAAAHVEAVVRSGLRPRVSAWEIGNEIERFVEKVCPSPIASPTLAMALSLYHSPLHGRAFESRGAGT